MADTQAIHPDLQFAPEGTTLLAYLNVGGFDWRAERHGATPVDTAVVTDGVATFTALENYSDYWAVKATNKVETVAVDAEGGTFTLTFNGQTTTAINFDADDTTGAASVRALLEALSTIAVGDVTVTGGPGDDGGTTPFVVTFHQTLAATPLNLTGSGASLTGGAGTVTITHTTAGGLSERGINFQCGDAAVLPGHPVARRNA